MRGSVSLCGELCQLGGGDYLKVSFLSVVLGDDCNSAAMITWSVPSSDESVSIRDYLSFINILVKPYFTAYMAMSGLALLRRSQKGS